MAKSNKSKTVVLTIAGHDPSSGAGITADIKTIAAHRCYGLSCITALTIQSSRGVRDVEPVEGRIVSLILEELANDVEISAVKIGMLGSAEVARAVSGFLRRHHFSHIVLDPILKSSSGADLLSKDGRQILREKLLSQATVITPNIAEAAELTGSEVRNVDQMKTAAVALQRMQARNVIITGGHLDLPVDLMSAVAGGVTLLKGEHVASSSTHGTGCAFSTALACNLALGKSLMQAAKLAKAHVETGLRKALQIGRGVGSVV